MRRRLVALAFSLWALSWMPTQASAFPNYGTFVDSTCTANGWIPAKPFNPNQVTNPTASTTNCGLCHANASSPSAKLTTSGQVFKASGYTDVSPFCKPPATNGAPVFAPVAAQRVTVGQLFQLSVRATDPDGNSLKLAATNLPLGAVFSDLGGGAGAFSWTPTLTQVGSVVVRFTATDSGSPSAGAALDVTIAVDPPPNRPPVFAAIPAQQTTAGQLFQLVVRASDPDGNAITLAASSVPAGATFSDRRDGTGTFAWTPTRAQSGNFVVRFHATDTGSPAASASLDVAIAVDAAPNRPPVFTPIGTQQVMAGQPLQLDVRATDPDGDALSLSASSTPAGALFSDRGDGTGVFQWTPSASQAGNTVVTFHAVDGGVPMASATLDVPISVGSVANHPPVLDPIGNRLLRVGESLSVQLSATDPDNDTVAFSVQPLPPGAASSPTGFTWAPTAGQSGNYTITATATDSGTPALSDSETFVVTVGAVNRAPELSPIGDRSALIGEVVRIALIASDPDGNAITLSCSGLPSDAALTDLADGTGEIVWMPAAAGRWSVTCLATDDAMPPAAGQQSFVMTASDPAVPPSDVPALSAARWDGSRERLTVVGAMPRLRAGESAPIELRARLADGVEVSLGTRRIQIGAGGVFRVDLTPFIPPCRVLAAIDGRASAVIGVASAPARCDEQLLMQLTRLRLSCDGRTLSASGRRAPPAGTVVGSDAGTGTTLFSQPARSNGSFELRVGVKTAPRSVRAEALAGGHRWALDALVPVTRDRCDEEAEAERSREQRSK
jgi:hypothetical protein